MFEIIKSNLRYGIVLGFTVICFHSTTQILLYSVFRFFSQIDQHRMKPLFMFCLLDFFLAVFDLCETICTSYIVFATFHQSNFPTTYISWRVWVSICLSRNTDASLLLVRNFCNSIKVERQTDRQVDYILDLGIIIFIYVISLSKNDIFTYMRKLLYYLYFRGKQWVHS